MPIFNQLLSDVELNYAGLYIETWMLLSVQDLTPPRCVLCFRSAACPDAEREKLRLGED